MPTPKMHYGLLIPLLAVGIAISVTAFWALPELLGTDTPTEEGTGDLVDLGRAERTVERTGGATLVGHGHAPGSSAEGLRGILMRGGFGVAGEIRAWTMQRTRRARPRTWLESQNLTALFSELDTRPADVTTRSAADGTFRLPPLPTGLYFVVGRQGAIRRARVLRVIGPQDVQIVRIVLPASTTRVEGVVRTSDGRPWVGHVGLRTEGLWEEHCCVPAGAAPSTQTDTEGRFVLEGVPVGKSRLICFLPGRFVGVSTAIWAPSASPIELVVGANTVSMQGTVRSAVDDAPIREAEIAVRLATGFHRTVSDEEGRFLLELPRWPHTTWSVSAEGYTTQWLPSGAPLTQVLIKLLPLGRVRGRVLDAQTGDPVAGLQVEIWAEHGEWNVREGNLAVTRSDGTFLATEVPVGPARVCAHGNGYATRTVNGEPPSRARIHVGHEEKSEVDVRVARGGRIVGRVVNASDRPVAGAVVVPEPSVFLPWYQDPEDETTSDENGRFELRGLKSSAAYRLIARVPPSTYGEASAKPGQTQPVEIRVLESEAYVVKVVDAEGEAAVPVSTYLQRGRFRWYENADAEGVARILATPGGSDLELVVESPDFAPHRRTIPAGDLGPHVVELTRTHRIAGRALYRNGVPAGGLYVSLSGGENKGATKTDEKGRFEFRHVPAGRHDVRCRMEGPEEGRETVLAKNAMAGETDITFRFDIEAPAEEEHKAEPNSVSLVVLKPDGHPVPRATMTYTRGNRGYSAPVIWGRTSLPEDTSDFHIHDAEDGSGQRLPLQPYRAQALPPGTPPHRVILKPGFSIAGHVETTDGKPVAGASLRSGWNAPAARSDRRGRFRLTGLAPGEHQIRCHAPSGFVTPEPQVASTGEEKLVFQLERSVAILIHVQDLDGRPLRSTRVHVEGPDYNRSHATRADGSTQFRGLHPKRRYTLAVRPDDETHADLHGLTRKGWLPRDETVTLSRGLSVHGIVVDEHDQPVRGARIAGRQGREVHRTETDAAGQFVLAGLTKGDVELLMRPPAAPDPSTGARVAQLGRRRKERVRISAGASGLRLRLNQGLSFDVHVTGWPNNRRLEEATFFAIVRGKASPIARAYVSDDGHVQAVHASRDTEYAILIGPCADGRYGLVEGVRAGQGTVRVALHMGGMIRGQVEGLPVDASYPKHVHVAGRYVAASVKVEEDGSFELGGLPAGRYTISADYVMIKSTRDDPWQAFRGEATAEPGDRVVLRMKRVP